MKTSAIVGIAIPVALLIFLGIAVGKYNSLVRLSEAVENAHAQVSTTLQRRADLIENIAEATKAYASHEQKTFIETAQARSGIAKANPTPENQKAASEAVQQAMVAINAVKEAYPTLKADGQFTRLTKELTNTEKAIQLARMRSNQYVRAYNQSIRTFPGSLVASYGGFEKKEYFEADAGAEHAPKLKF